MEIDVLTKEQKMMIKLWEDGNTGLQIAEKLGKTRNAIMGALKRLRDKGLIEYKQVPVKRSAPLPRKENLKYLPIRNRRILREIKHGVRETPLIEVSPEVKYIRNGPVRFFDLTSQSCRFIINDTLPQNFLFCGDQKKDGSPYCERHHKMCYVPGSSEVERTKRRKRLKYDPATKSTYSH